MAVKLTHEQGTFKNRELLKNLIKCVIRSKEYPWCLSKMKQNVKQNKHLKTLKTNTIITLKATPCKVDYNFYLQILIILII